MKDLEIAKLRLKEKELTLVIVKDCNIIYETKSHGISDLLQAVEKLTSGLSSSKVNKLVDSSVADRIVGRAVALLCAYCKVASIFALTISEEGRKVLENSRIRFQFEKSVKNILNFKKDDICPFEKIVAGITSPKEAYEKLKAFSGFIE